MKYVIRRIIAAVIAIPFIAGANVFATLTTMLIFPDFDSVATLEDSYNSGIIIAVSVAVSFIIGPDIKKIKALGFK
jgi:hypothetical protein